MIRGWAAVAVAGSVLMAAGGAIAQEAAGVWHGVLTTPGGALRLVVKLKRAAAGGLEGEMVSPDQTAKAVALGEVKAGDGQLSFAVPQVRGRYEGRWDAAKNAWVGAWSQGVSLPLTLEAGDLPPGPVVQGLDGEWRGALPIPTGGQLRLVLHVRTGAYGTVASLDSPDQLTYGIAVTGLTRDGQSVRFETPAVRGAWTGALTPDGKTLDGTWTQLGKSRPLALALGGPQPAVSRPQTPKPPFPYRAVEVKVASAPGVTLAGTLTLPEGKGPFPAAVMITGSGAQDRDEAILGHKPFAVIADALTRRGVAVLRLDDRGVGQSTGDFVKATETDFAADTEAAVRYLRARGEIDPRRIGLIGHSEGGLIAPMVANQDPRIAFLVLMAGPGAPMIDVLNAQRLALAPAMGVDVKQAAKMNTALSQALAEGKSAGSPDEVRARVAAVLREASPTASDVAIQTQAQMLTSEWFRGLASYDPGPALRRLHAPVLALVGSKDRQVPADQNIPALRANLKDNPKATVLELPGLNHLFQTAPTGAVGEYADISETIAPSALQTIGDWVVEQTRR